jgi:hypothetical protein
MPQDFPEKIIPMGTKSSGLLRLVEHVVSDVSKDRNVIYFKGQYKLDPEGGGTAIIRNVGNVFNSSTPNDL